jgi:hypothetical protein
MVVDQKTLAGLCRTYGAFLLNLPADVEGPKLLWALAGNESDFGSNAVPRHEQGYCYGGRYFDHNLTKQFGCHAHCSYGPFQIMAEFAPGFTVTELNEDAEKATQASLGFLNRKLEHFKPKLLDEIGEIWNTGHIAPDPDYVAKLLKNYAVEMPL